MTTGTPPTTVVMVARDRWAPAPRTLALLLERTDPRHPIVVVDGGAPRPVAAAFDAAAATGRVRVVRRSRFLGGNEARNLGLDAAPTPTEWVAIVESDAAPSGGWVDRLVELGESVDAASVYPAYLERHEGRPRVHGLGADLDVSGPTGSRVVRERQHHLLGDWDLLAPTLAPVRRVQAEPHALAIRAEVVDAMGGFDERLLGWFDHTDVALHHLHAGVDAWLLPSVTCVYAPPPPVHPRDLTNVAVRWGAAALTQSLAHLCRKWGLDHTAGEWHEHERYRRSVRRQVPTRSRRLNAALERATQPWERRRARALVSRGAGPGT